MKSALTILCSLMFLWGQTVAMTGPTACASQPAHHCGHACKMPCCAASPTSVPQSPATAAVPASSQQQILTPVPAVAVLVLATAGTSDISPVVATSLHAADAPLFARHCVRLI